MFSRLGWLCVILSLVLGTPLGLVGNVGPASRSVIARLGSQMVFLSSPVRSPFSAGSFPGMSFLFGVYHMEPKALFPCRFWLQPCFCLTEHYMIVGGIFFYANLLSYSLGGPFLLARFWCIILDTCSEFAESMFQSQAF